MSTVVRSCVLYPIGVFGLLLGTAHFFFPVLFDFRRAIPPEGAPLKPFHLLGIHYATKRNDVYGLAWVMNHCVSFVLVTIGVLDVCWPMWLPTSGGPLLSYWISGWWCLRGVCQLYLGRRQGDWRILWAFVSLSVLQAGVTLLP